MPYTVKCLINDKPVNTEEMGQHTIENEIVVETVGAALTRSSVRYKKMK